MSSKFSDNAVAGMAVASIELHRTMISLMIMHKVIPKVLALELIDQSLQVVEKYQMSGIPSLEAPAQAARLHLEVLLRTLRQLPVED